MRLKSFRVFRYKSIVDSGECALASDFTVLIGKNESGKTAILEALRDFDRGEQGISPQAVTINGMHGNPELQMTFEISGAELENALKEADFSIPDDLKQKILSTGIKLRKSYEGEYRINESAFTSLNGEGPQTETEAEIDNAARKQRLSEILKVHPVPDLKIGQDVHALQESIADLRRLVKSRLNFINDESQKVEAVEILHAMTHSVSGKSKPLTPSDKFIHALVKLMPRFIYFSDFKDILPFEIAIDSLKGNQTVCDFASLAHLDLDQIISTQDTQRRINLLNRASAIITGAFFEHWKQDRIELIARPEGNKILFGVKEHSGTDVYKMEQRSRGFQWFLSFYLRVNRYHNENVVLLIDEPGMNLHPMAQKNIMSVMEQKASNTMRILFSTHSPSLIDPQRLDRIRCVIKNKVVGSLVVTGVTDAVDMETLMPVETATGVHSMEQLKALFMGKKIVKETPVAPELTASPAPAAAVEVKQPVAQAPASAPVQPAQPVLKQAPLPEKAAEKKPEQEETEEELEYAPRKPLFRLFGR